MNSAPLHDTQTAVFEIALQYAETETNPAARLLEEIGVQGEAGPVFPLRDGYFTVTDQSPSSGGVTISYAYPNYYGHYGSARAASDVNEDFLLMQRNGQIGALFAILAQRNLLCHPEDCTDLLAEQSCLQPPQRPRPG